jgi:cobalt/nickel transport system ATP-binding protein
VRKGSVYAEGTPAEIFYDEELLNETGLLPPQIVTVYRAYCKMQGIPADQHPVNIDEMMAAIRGK